MSVINKQIDDNKARSDKLLAQAAATQLASATVQQTAAPTAAVPAQQLEPAGSSKAAAAMPHATAASDRPVASVQPMELESNGTLF